MKMKAIEQRFDLAAYQLGSPALVLTVAPANLAPMTN